MLLSGVQEKMKLEAVFHIEKLLTIEIMCLFVLMLNVQVNIIHCVGPFRVSLGRALRGGRII